MHTAVPHGCSAGSTITASEGQENKLQVCMWQLNGPDAVLPRAGLVQLGATLCPCYTQSL